MVRISVVVPVYNDPDGIRATLESVAALDYPADDHEILVVDNDSTDTTRAAASAIADTEGQISVGTETERQSSYAARNTGVRRANGDIIAFLDADMTVGESWLADIESAFETTGADYLGYDVELYLSGNESTLLGAYDVSVGFSTRVTLQERNYVPTCCLAVRRDVFDDVGLFDSRLVSSGDREFGQRVADAGYDQVYSSEITASHPARTSIREVLQKAARIAKGQEQIHRLYPDSGWTRPWYHPFNVLPPRPRFLYRKMDAHTSPFRFFQFYVVAYAKKLLRTVFRVKYQFERPMNAPPETRPNVE